METGDEAEGTLGCLQEGDDGEVGCRRACIGEPPPDPLGRDHRTGPWQRTGTVGEGDPAHPDDTCGGGCSGAISAFEKDLVVFDLILMDLLFQ